MTRGVASLLCMVVLSSCGFSGLNFRQDERLDITSPEDRASVTLPVTVTWRVEGFEITGPDGRGSSDAGYFGVYVDRAPQPADRRQDWLVRDDRNCTTGTVCDEAYLAGLNVFSTSEPRFVIESVPAPASTAQRRREFHDVTIVLLNGRGERIGESAFVRQFEVDRG